MSSEKEIRGVCFCGAVEFRVTGKPVAMGYCHCNSCREWAAAPVNAFTLWPPKAVSFTRGSELVGSYSRTDRSIRKSCTRCGGHLMNEHPTWGVIDVYAAAIPTLPFDPMFHVNYGESVLRLRDGLPKHKDFPKDMGGSGTLIPE
jgi:hypothetical protein